MKKYLIALILMCTTYMTANAEFNFGMRAGYNITSRTGGLNSDNRAGFFIGPTIKFTVPVTGLSVDVSALYDSRTANYDGDISITSKQICIPINARYGLGTSKVFNFFVYGGPQIGFNVGRKLSIWDTTSYDEYDWSWKAANFSINIGAGVTLIKHLEVKVNYNVVCGRNFECKSLLSSETYKGSYNAWQMGLAYYF